MKIFPYQPEGSQPLLERLIWSTDIQPARSGKEHRRSLRTRPRYEYEYSLALSAQLQNGYADALADMRSYTGDWLVPLWPHASGTAAKPTSGLDATGRCLGMLADGHAVEVLDVVPPGVVDLVPAAAGRIVEALKIRHTTNDLAGLSVTVELSNHGEVVAPFGLNENGVPVFDFDSDWSGGADEDISRDENRLDYGGLWAVETRYQRRTFGMSLYLDSAEKIARFRSFLFTVRGAHLSFLANPGVDAEPTLWRLNSDAVEILHYNPNLATSKITLKQV